MKKTTRRWSLEQKREAVARMTSCRHEQLAEELGVQRRQLYAWRKELRKREGLQFPSPGREHELELENRRLREALANKVLEADFLQGALRRIEARRQSSSGCGETASTKKSGS